VKLQIQSDGALTPLTPAAMTAGSNPVGVTTAGGVE
jgi:hypothetical protein